MSLDNYQASFERPSDLKATIQPSLAKAAVEGHWRKMDFPDMRYAVLYNYNIDHLPSGVTIREITREERVAVGMGYKAVPYGRSDEFGFRPAHVFVPDLDTPLTLRQFDKLAEYRNNQQRPLSEEGER